MSYAVGVVTGSLGTVADRGKPDSREVGERIKRRRAELGMKRRELAEAAGISYPYISQLETGSRDASLPTQIAIARALDVSLDALFAPEDLPGSSPSSTTAPPVSGSPNHPGAAPPATTPSPFPSTTSILDMVVEAATQQIERLPTSMRVDALNKIQLRVMRSLAPSSRIIEHLGPDEVFVFGSNARGIHDGGAARQAFEKFGAEWGNGHGRQGASYAIDTMSGFPTLTAEVKTFLNYARRHPRLRFLLTPIGTGIAGYRADQIAPLFANRPDNVFLPPEFTALLDNKI